MAKRVSLKGKGADLFFGDFVPDQPSPEAPDSTPTDRDGSSPLPADTPLAEPAPSTDRAAPPGSRARPARTRTTDGGGSRRRTPARPSASDPDSRLASMLASVDASTVEAIRKVVKVPGREVSFVRLTADEKAQVDDIVYTYKRRGQKTSENEINRIALNYLLLDYEEHGEQSVLARVLAALLA